MRATRQKAREHEHGTRQRYARGCRCDACRASWAAYMRTYKRERFGVRPRSERLIITPREPTFYEGKARQPESVSLTEFGKRLLSVIRARTARSRGDIFERLLREHAAELKFNDDAA